ncbi:hypothetical protein CDAR_399261 [Caerostris darwini]|uniref:Uncharacterized protein n=1 Tax=Caerostris darwini TaxID=1538125 RepID=A0AAV4T086_9ARAC|nr:hypothetical protein CDAR_399261 [Caerostris darwini]
MAQQQRMEKKVHVLKQCLPDGDLLEISASATRSRQRLDSGQRGLQKAVLGATEFQQWFLSFSRCANVVRWKLWYLLRFFIFDTSFLFKICENVKSVKYFSRPCKLW